MKSLAVDPGSLTNAQTDVNYEDFRVRQQQRREKEKKDAEAKAAREAVKELERQKRMRQFMFDWWHVAAISLAMAHFTWIRYHYQFVSDYDQRDELDIEASLFLDPEEQSEHLISPLMAPVISTLINKDERHLITDPIIDRAAQISHYENLCEALFRLNKRINN